MKNTKLLRVKRDPKRINRKKIKTKAKTRLINIDFSEQVYISITLIDNNEEEIPK